MIRRNTDDIALFRFQSDGYGFGVILRIGSLIDSADPNHGIAAFCRFVTNMFKIGCGSVLMINADQITVRIAILLQGQFILEVTVRLGIGNNRYARHVAVAPTQFLARAENNAVDLIGFGVDRTDIIVTAGHIDRYGQGMASAFQYRTVLYHANPITGIGFVGIIVLAQIKTYLVKFAHVGSVPCQVDGISVCGTADCGHLGHRRHVVEQNITARRRGQIPCFVVLVLIRCGKSKGRTLGCFVIGQVGICNA